MMGKKLFIRELVHNLILRHSIGDFFCYSTPVSLYSAIKVNMYNVTIRQFRIENYYQKKKKVQRSQFCQTGSVKQENLKRENRIW